MKITQNGISSITAGAATDLRWRKNDTVWMLGLYGTAIGAGVLFLPINAGIGGLAPLIIMAILAFPLTYFSHRGLTRFVLSGKKDSKDITDVVEEHFGEGAGKIITFLYFLTIYPVMLMYCVAITNTVESFIIQQLGHAAPPRILLSLILVTGLMAVVMLGEKAIVKVMGLLVFPFIVVLMLLSIYLIPHWNGEVLKTLSFSSTHGSGGGLLVTLWQAIPVMVFSFNHSPIISPFAVAVRAERGEAAERMCSRVLAWSHLIMVMTVMFFVFSCVLSLSPDDLRLAKEQNVTILSYLANHFNVPTIAWLGPIVAIVAISKSFFGHYLGALEGFNAIVSKVILRKGKSVKPSTMDRAAALFILLSSWGAATWNPSILGIIETLSGPVIALILFLMPMYAIQKVPAMQKYSGHISNIFVVAIAIVTISAIFFSTFK